MYEQLDLGFPSLYTVRNKCSLHRSNLIYNTLCYSSPNTLRHIATAFLSLNYIKSETQFINVENAKLHVSKTECHGMTNPPF
jgi:hypothetical protein